MTIDTGNVSVDNSSDQDTIAAQIAGDNGLTSSGSGTVVLAGSNSYTGNTTVSAGVLDLQNSGALPGYDSSGQVSVASGATLAVKVGGSGDWSSDDIGTLVSYAGFAASGATLGIDTTDDNFTCDTDISDPSGVSLGLAVLGGNTLTLSGSNTYSGATTVVTGTLMADSNTAFKPLGFGDERCQRGRARSERQ